MCIRDRYCTILNGINKIKIQCNMYLKNILQYYIHVAHFQKGKKRCPCQKQVFLCAKQSCCSVNTEHQNMGYFGKVTKGSENRLN